MCTVRGPRLGVPFVALFFQLQVAHLRPPFAYILLTSVVSVYPCFKICRSATNAKQTVGDGDVECVLSQRVGLGVSLDQTWSVSMFASLKLATAFSLHPGQVGTEFHNRIRQCAEWDSNPYANVRYFNKFCAVSAVKHCTNSCGLDTVYHTSISYNR